MSRKKRIGMGMLASQASEANEGDKFQLLSRTASPLSSTTQATNSETSSASSSNTATTQEPKSPASSKNAIPASSSGSETNTNNTNGELHNALPNNNSASKKTTLPQPESTKENLETASSSESITVMTYNITSQPIDEEETDIDSWTQRKETIANTITKASPDILAVQEASLAQVQDLEKLLSTGSTKYQWFGQGAIYYGLPAHTEATEEGESKEETERDPRPAINHKDFSGEYVPIFYNSAKLKLLQCGTFWLSKDETLLGSRGWDSVAPRICTFCRFSDRRTKKAFWVFNTHFDQGRFARKNSCLLLRRKILEMSIDSDTDELLPAILVGDLNILPTSPLFAFLTTGQKPPTQPSKKNGSEQEKSLEELDYASEDESEDLQLEAANDLGTSTYTGFNSSLNSTVDYVLVTYETISVAKTSVVSDARENGRQASTHRPVLAELIIQ